MTLQYDPYTGLTCPYAQSHSIIWIHNQVQHGRSLINLLKFKTQKSRQRSRRYNACTKDWIVLKKNLHVWGKKCREGVIHLQSHTIPLNLIHRKCNQSEIPSIAVLRERFSTSMFLLQKEIEFKENHLASTSDHFLLPLYHTCTKCNCNFYNFLFLKKTTCSQPWIVNLL